MTRAPARAARARAGTAMLCTNPLTGARGGAAPASRNLGTLVPNADMSDAEFRARRGAGALRSARLPADRRQ